MMTTTKRKTTKKKISEEIKPNSYEIVQVQNSQSSTAIEKKELSADDIVRQVEKVNELYKKVMKDGYHYGKIPGCGDKPTLLKPGAEKIMMMFMLYPKIEKEKVVDLGNGHREYTYIIGLYHRKTGECWGDGVGSASTMEKKFRYRNEYRNTGREVPKEYWDTKDRSLLGCEHGIIKKINGKYIIFEKIEKENPNIADTYNTVRKIAKKRALVDAVLTTTGVSDIFTQDVEELVENEVIKPVPNKNNDKPKINTFETPIDEMPNFE